jgi:hypothetical protein
MAFALFFSPVTGRKPLKSALFLSHQKSDSSNSESLVYRVSSRTARDTQRNPVSENQKKKKKKRNQTPPDDLVVGEKNEEHDYGSLALPCLL